MTAAAVPLLVLTIVGLTVLWPREGATDRATSLGEQAPLEEATVTRITPVPCGRGGTEVPGRCSQAEIRVQTGPGKGSRQTLDLTSGPGQPELAVGDGIVVGRAADPGGDDIYYFADFQRRSPLIVLAVLFALVVVAVGRARGLAALAGVAVSFGVLVAFVLPAILAGSSPLAVSVVGSSAMMFALLYLAHGVTAMTTTALLGTLASLALTGGLAAAFVEVAHLVNLGSEEATFLQFSASQVNLQGLLLGSIIIGSLGVLNDVTVTQASAVWQLRAADPRAGARQLYGSAMRIGRDHIASAIDTLVLAYAGASLPLLLLFTLASRPVGDVLTGSLVAEEIVRTLVGSIGLVASVPITTGLAAFVAARSEPGSPPASPRHVPKTGRSHRH